MLHVQVIVKQPSSDNTPYEKIGDEVRSLVDEVPFDIPDSWEWVRLSQIALVLNGDRGKNYPSKEKLVSSGIPFISALNLDGRTVVKDGNLLCVTEEQYNLLANGKLKEGDIVVCIRGSLGKHAKYPFEKGAIASSLVILRTLSNEETLADYIMMWLDSPLFFSEIRKYDNGTAQPNLAAKSLEQFFVPIPPLGEQRRIVEKINEVTSAVSAYDVAYQRNETLNSAFPESLKKSILQEAVQGKLVSQDPSDEPAEALLERIRAEKQRLIKEGKIKKEKHESIIFRRDNSHYEKLDGVERCIDDELPFEIPNSWHWVRLSDICEYIQRGKSPKYSQIKKYPVIAQKCNQWSGFSIEKAQFVEPESICTYGQERFLQDNDLMWNSTGLGTLGRMAIYKCELNPYGSAVADSHVTVIRPMKEFVLPQYLYFYFSNPTVQSVIEDQADGTTKQKELSTTTVRSYLVPLPPYNEQIRIVKQTEAVLTLVMQI